MRVRGWGRGRGGNGDGGGDERPNARQNGDDRGDTNEGSSTNGNGEVNKRGFRRTEMGAGPGAGPIIEKTRGEERVNPGTYEGWKTMSDVNRKTRERGRHRREIAATDARSDASAKPPHHAEGQGSAMGGQEQDRGG